MFKLFTDRFLEEYTDQHIGPETGLPVVTLKNVPKEGFKCIFVSSDGCRVYSDRPSSCRTYPLARMLARSRETGQIDIQYGLLVEPHCQGHDQNRKQTVHEWITSQDVGIYNEINDRMIDIISVKNRLLPGPLDAASRSIFHMACYDLDTFRPYLENNYTSRQLNLNPESWQAILEDDVELLKFGLIWVKQALFTSLSHNK